MNRLDKVHELEKKREFGIPLTERQNEILTKWEIIKRWRALMWKYQIGDPTEIDAKTRELCELLDEELANG